METDSEITGRYIDRVAFVRKRRGITQAEMAEALSISVERYRKYEHRSPLPVWLLERFCAIVGADIEYVITGRARWASH